jgi:hypothetical protein
MILFITTAVKTSNPTWIHIPEYPCSIFYRLHQEEVRMQLTAQTLSSAMCSICDEYDTSPHQNVNIIRVTHRVSAFGIQPCVKCLKRICLGAYGVAGLCNFAEKVCALVHTIFTDVHVLLRRAHWTTLAVCVEVQHPAVPHYQIQWHHLIQWHSHNFIQEELP